MTKWLDELWPFWIESTDDFVGDGGVAIRVIAIVLTIAVLIVMSVVGAPIPARAAALKSAVLAPVSSPQDFSAKSATSADIAVDGVGETDGYHLRIAQESAGFVWRDLAVIKPANLDEENWYGYQCLSSDGKYVAVAILPGSLENDAVGRLGGGFAYGVEVSTGKVTALASGVGSMYFSPSCSTDDTAVFSSSLGSSQQITQLLRVNLSTGKQTSDSIVRGEVTSAVGVGSTVVAALENTLVNVTSGGTVTAPIKATVVATTPGTAYDIVPSKAGGVDYVTSGGKQVATVWHHANAPPVKLGAGPVADVHVFLGRGGHNSVIGTKTLKSNANLRQIVSTKLPLGARVVSLDADAAFGPQKTTIPTKPSKIADDPTTTSSGVANVEALNTHHLFKTSFGKNSAASTQSTGPQLPQSSNSFQPAPTQPAPQMKGAVFVGTGGATESFSGDTVLASLPNSVPAILPLLSPGATTPKCSIDRLQSTIQPMQESNAQINWAVQMAERGLLTGSTYTRPANFAGMGLAAYAPSSDFPPVALSHPSGSTSTTVPRSVMEAIMAQESNFDQASWHAISGISADPLIADYYGSAGGISSIYYPSADCGYGISQVTTGMAVADTTISRHGEMKIATDYEENIAAGLQILEEIWNQLYGDGITANGGDPKYLENWFFAAWAYNSGIQPTSQYNSTGCTPGPSCTGADGTWGLGWSNNPANPLYDPSRSPYLETSYADAAHPSSWPYEERIMGFMGSALARNNHTAYATPTYNGGESWLQIPNPSYFCTTADKCATSGSSYYCTLSDSECWTHAAMTWITSCSSTCTTSDYDVSTTSTEPSYSDPYPPECQLDPTQVPSTSAGAPIIVDDLATPSQNRQGCSGFNWSNSGTFTLSPGTNSSGDPVGDIDLHQLGVGFGGHIYFTHTEDGSNTSLIDTGTWTPTLPSYQYYEVKVHIPDRAAVATDAHYVINPGGGGAPHTVAINQDYETNTWVDLGTFAMQSGGNVKLTNLSAMTPGKYDIAFDSMAFIPRGGTPGTPIGGSPTLLQTPAWTNPSLLNCLCGLGVFADPVSSRTGYFGETETDLSTPGIGDALNLQRTYSSSLADPSGPSGTDSINGPFGHGWSYSYGMTANTNSTTGAVTVRQEDGSEISFTPDGSGAYSADQPRFAATLSKSGSTYTFTRTGSETFLFDLSSGHLTNESDQAGLHATPQYSTGLTYDSSGNLHTVTDPAGRSYTFTWTGTHITKVTAAGSQEVDYVYDASGNLTDVYGVGTSRPGGVLGDQDHAQYGYDTADLMTSERTPANFGKTSTPTPVTAMVYDSSERVTSQTDPMGNTTTFVYGPDASAGITAGQTLVTDPSGHKTLDSYSSGLLTSEIAGYGTSLAETTSYSYDPLSLGVTSVTNADGSTETYAYDGSGYRTSSTDGLGRTTATSYDNAGHLLQTTTPDMRQTITAYNAAGAPTSVTVLQPGQDAEVADGNLPASNARVSTYTYSDASRPNQVSTATDALDHASTFTYDSEGYRTSATDAASNVTKYGYDTDRGLLTAVVTPMGVVAGTTPSCTPPATGCTTYDHDAWGRITTTTDAAGHSATTSYDADGNKLVTTDANAHSTTTTYDNDGRALSTTTPGGQQSGTSYNADGTIASTTDAASKTTSNTYDSLGRIASTTDPDGQTTSFTYDAMGRQLTSTSPAGNVSHQTWDAAGQLSGITYTGGATTPATSFTYTIDGQHATMTDGTGTTSYTYDPYGELVGVTTGSGSTVGYGYDADGHQTTLSYPGTGNTVTRTFNSLGQISAIHDAANRATTFAYNADGALLTTTEPNGNTVTNAYDATHRMQSTALSSSSAALGTLTYTRDNSGDVKTSVPSDGAPGVSTTYSYNSNQQLTAAATSSATAAYSYDAVGSPTNVGSSTQTFDDAGRLCWSNSSAVTGPSCGTVPTGSTSFAYDANGQRTTTTPPTGTATTYSWNAANELSSVGGTTTASYTYDGTGLRASKTVGATTTAFTWDMTSPVPDLLTDGNTDYIYGPNGAPLEQTSPGGSNPQWYFTDQQGSTVELNDLTGATAGSYAYTAWGTVTSHTGTASTPVEYAGQYQDAETGLIYLRARYYDPQTAVFVSVDPMVASTLTRYMYVYDNPLNGQDPLGLWGVWDTIGAIGLGIGVVALAATGVGALVEISVGASLALSVAIDAAAVVGTAADGAACIAGSGVGCIGLAFNGLALAGAASSTYALVQGQTSVAEGLAGVSAIPAFGGVGADGIGLYRQVQDESRDDQMKGVSCG
jgi:RHS repeat-associated protein